MTVPDEEAQTIVNNLLSAEKPLLFLGNGCRRALLDPTEKDGKTRVERLAEACERIALPVMTTPDGKGIFPESHPMSLRMYGKASTLWPAAYMDNPKFDALLVIGSKLHQLATENWNPTLIPKGPFMQVDLDPKVIGRDFPLDLGLVGDAARTIDRLCERIEVHVPDEEEKKRIATRRTRLAAIRETIPYRYPEARKSDATPIKPQAMMTCLNELIPEAAQLLIDGGNCIGWAVHYMEIDPPTYRASSRGAAKCQMHNSLDMGPMGFATAAIVGAQVACPDQTCITVTGDGAFMMHGSEISTASQYGLGAIWIVLNDDDLGMVSQGMYVFSPLLESRKTPDPSWKGYYRLGGPDLVKYAEGLGADATRVSNPGAFRQAFQEAVKRSRPGKGSADTGAHFNLGGKPQVIVVDVDTKEIPPYYPPAEMPNGVE
jgi:acetolactate synthase-1/2/3 large subunit